MASGYWEREHLLRSADITIVGAGLVGMSTALALRRLQPEAHIRIVERHPLTDGGSSRNAGFACFGSAGEWLDDLTPSAQPPCNPCSPGRRDSATSSGCSGRTRWGWNGRGLGAVFKGRRSGRAPRLALDTLNPLLTGRLQSALVRFTPTRKAPRLGRRPGSGQQTGCCAALVGRHAAHQMVTAFHAALDAAHSAPSA